MSSNPIKIILADPSAIVYLGLKEVLTKGDQVFEFYHVDNFTAVLSFLVHHKIDVIVMNPLLVQNIEKQFLQCKSENPSIKWIAFINSLIDETLITLFDSKIMLNDHPDSILAAVQTAINEDRTDEATSKQPLSDREIEVLRLLVLGLSNKEIADKLYISTYTVISHRKNISQKTGIKSVSGLTIYAVVKGIITLNSLPE